MAKDFLLYQVDVLWGSGIRWLEEILHHLSETPERSKVGLNPVPPFQCWFAWVGWCRISVIQLFLKVVKQNLNVKKGARGLRYTSCEVVQDFFPTTVMFKGVVLV